MTGAVKSFNGQKRDIKTEKLSALLNDLGSLNSKLLLIAGPSSSGKTEILQIIAHSNGITVLNVGAELGARLANIPVRQRRLQATTILRELADKHAVSDLLLMDNIEILFDGSLQLDPPDMLKHHAHAKRVVAVWPGDVRMDRLTYAEMGHPEHQDYSLAGVVHFDIQK